MEEFDVPFRGIKMRIARDQVSILYQNREQDILSCTALVCWEEIIESKKILDGIF